ncbi:MAG TPA: hypothetical protein VIS31_00475 [Woeseiaceae bacterium]
MGQAPRLASNFVIMKGDFEASRGAWHAARTGWPTVLPFVTPGEGTENRDAPGPGGSA